MNNSCHDKRAQNDTKDDPQHKDSISSNIDPTKNQGLSHENLKVLFRRAKWIKFYFCFKALG